MVCICSSAHGQITNFSWPSTAPLSDKYTVKAGYQSATQEVYTHFSKPNLTSGPDGNGVTGILQDRTMSYAIFSFTGEVVIEVQKIYGTAAARVDISPKSYGINPVYFDGRKVRFKISDQLKPAYISVNFISDDNKDPDGSGGNDIKNGLMIFADKPETNIPSTTASGVLLYSNTVSYAQMQAASLIYFPPGDWDLINKFSDQHGNRGRYHIPRNGQQIYLAGGAFVRGSIDADGYDNCKLFGRGILSGADYVWHEMQEPNSSNILQKTAWLNFMGSNGTTYEGISLVHPCHHTCPSSNNTIIKNIKIIGWASNHDGIRPSGGSVVDEIFIKTSDDYDYARDPHVVRNSIFWPMRNGAGGMLGWNNLGVGKTTYENMHYINSEWNSYNRNRGIIGSVLQQGVNLANDTIRNVYAEDFCSLLSNITIQYEPADPFDAANPGEIKNFLFQNILFENTFKAANGTIIKQPIRGFVKDGIKAIIHDITFDNLILGNTLITASNYTDYFDIDANTAYNILFTSTTPLHNITATAGISGSVSPAGILPTPNGMNRVVNIIPNAGYKIKNVKVDGASIGRVQHYSFKDVVAPQTLEAEFEAGNDYFDFTTVTSVNDPSLEKEVNIFPTVTPSQLLIQNKSGKSITYFIRNSLGQQITQPVTLMSNMQAELVMGNWANGLYIVAIQAGKNKIYKKVIKQ